MASAPAAKASTEFEEVPLRRISEGWNSRRAFDERKLAELAEDIKLHGLLQPVVVRPQGDGYVLVVGARRFRASKLAGRETILARVVVMTDAAAAEANVVENVKREDLSPLEIADAYLELEKRHGYTAKQIAEKVGKSLSSVYAALKLCAASEEVRRAVVEDGLPASHAGLLARVSPAKQGEALQLLRDEAFGEGWPSFEEAERVVRESCMRELRGAPFDRAKPLAGAGPCGPCPKRAGNMGEEAKGRADVCTDTTCFAAKAKAAGEELVARARADGLEVLEGQKAQSATRYGGGYVALSSPCYEAPGPSGERDAETRSWGELLEKHAPELQPTTVAVVDGAAKLLLPKKEALAALAAKGQRWAKEELKVRSRSSASSDSFREQQARRQREAKRRHQVARQVLGDVGGRLELEQPDALVQPELWRLVAHLALLRAGHEGLKAFAVRREWEERGYGAKPQVVKLINSLDSARLLAGVALELLVVDEAAGSPWGGSYGDGLKLLAAHFGMDVKRLERDVQAAEKAKAKAKKGPAKAAAEAQGQAREWRLTSAKKAHAVDAERPEYALCGATLGNTSRYYEEGDRVCPKCQKAAGGPPPAPVRVADSRRKRR